MKPDLRMERLESGDESTCPPASRARWLAAPGLALAVIIAPRPARADDLVAPDSDAAFSGTSLAAGLSSRLPMRLVGGFRPAGHHGGGGGPRGGSFLGVDTGAAISLPAGGDGAERAFSFALRTGYELPSGLAVQLRYDYLGVAPHLTMSPTSPTQIGSAGVRYSIPFLFPMPFFEAMWGPAVDGRTVSIAGSLGAGASFPIGRHVRVDASVRDWITPINARLRQILTFELGVAVSFASPSCSRSSTFTAEMARSGTASAARPVTQSSTVAAIASSASAARAWRCPPSSRSPTGAATCRSTWSPEAPPSGQPAS
jgi:hypothetical protein